MDRRIRLMFQLSRFFFFNSMLVVIGAVLLSKELLMEFQHTEAVIFSLFCALIISYRLYRKKLTTRFYENFFFYVLFFLTLGLISLEIETTADPRKKSDHFEKAIEKHYSSEIIIRLEKAQLGKSFNRYECEVLGTIKDNEIIESSGKLLLFVDIKEESVLFEPGCIFLTDIKIWSIKKSKETDVVNWMRFYELKGIYHQAFVKTSGDLKVLGKQKTKYDDALQSARTKLKYRLVHYLGEGETYALLSAMILGDKTSMSSATRKAFSKSGVMHVLAVSGLHVGIIYLLLSKIIFTISILLRRQINSTVLLVTGIWIYACLTGFSASVVRASFMFTLFAMARLTGGKANMINVLACSACVLTLLNPLIIYQIGFQLSHIAVAGIVLLYPIINAVFSFKNKALSYIWSLLSVSLAAQLCTFPLATYYFDIFPNYFLLSNIIAVPVAGIIISLGIVLISSADVGIVAAIIADILSVIVMALQKAIGFISELPGSVSVLHFDITDVLLIYVCLILSIVTIYYPGKRQLYILMAVILTSLGIMQSKRYLIDKTKTVVGHGDLSEFRTTYPLATSPFLK